MDKSGKEGIVGIDLTQAEDRTGLVYFKRRNTGLTKKSIHKGSSFYDLIHIERLGIVFGFEVNPQSGLAGLRKISRTEWVYKIRNFPLYYNEKPGKQLRKDRFETRIGVTTGKNEITILHDLARSFPQVLKVIEVKKGDYIIDFRLIGDDCLATVSENGYLNIYKYTNEVPSPARTQQQIGQTEPRFAAELQGVFKIQTIRLDMELGESVTAMDVSPGENYIVIASSNMASKGSAHMISVINKQTSLGNFATIPFLDYFEKRELLPTYDITLSMSSSKQTDELMLNAYSFLEGKSGYNIFLLKNDKFLRKNIDALNHKNPPMSFDVIGTKVASIDSLGWINILDAEHPDDKEF